MNRHTLNTLLQDGRCVIVILVALYAFLFLSIQSYSSFSAAASLMLNVPVMEPVFSDLRVIHGAYQSLQNDFDPYANNPFDPWGRKYNYPPIWIYMLGPVLTSDNIYFFGGGFILLFVFALYKFIGRVSVGAGLVYGFIAVSPVTFLLLERANIDILIFLICICMLLNVKTDQKGQYLSAIVVAFASILKLYPIFVVGNLPQERRRYVRIAGIVVVIFSIYVSTIFPEILSISENTPRSAFRSYGCAIVPMFIQGLWKGIAPNSTAAQFDPLIVGVSVLAVLMFGVFWHTRKMHRISIPEDSDHIHAFRTGACIFVGTFALGNNWDYRLIFLFLTVPQLLQWYKEKTFHPHLVTSAIVCIVLLMNWMMVSSEHTYRTLLLNELFTWYLVGILSCFYLRSLPAWLKY